MAMFWLITSRPRLSIGKVRYGTPVGEKVGWYGQITPSAKHIDPHTCPTYIEVYTHTRNIH